ERAGRRPWRRQDVRGPAATEPSRPALQRCAVPWLGSAADAVVDDPLADVGLGRPDDELDEVARPELVGRALEVTQGPDGLAVDADDHGARRDLPVDRAERRHVHDHHATRVGRETELLNI